MPRPFSGSSHMPDYNDDYGFGHVHRAKRPRSPSPASPGFDLALPSPLEDVLQKRRRRDDNFGYFGHVNPHQNAIGSDAAISNGHSGAGGGGGGGGDSAGAAEGVVPGVERRRNRLWLSRNAPSSQGSLGSQEMDDRSGRSGGNVTGLVQNGYGYGFGSSSQAGPSRLSAQSQSNEAGMSRDPSPPSFFPPSHSQPEAPFTAPRASQRAHPPDSVPPRHLHNAEGLHTGGRPSSAAGQHAMSSSPVRHEPPGSSPFKSSQATYIDEEGDADGDTTLRPSQRSGIFATGPALRGPGGLGSGDMQQRQSPGVEEDAEMDMEELEREWGEYRGANSLLYQLHRARTTPQFARTRQPIPSAFHTPNHQQRSEYDNHGTITPVTTPSYVPQHHTMTGNGMAHTPDMSAPRPALHHAHTQPVHTPIRQPHLHHYNPQHHQHQQNHLDSNGLHQADQSGQFHGYRPSPTDTPFSSSPFAPPSSTAASSASAAMGRNYDASSPLPPQHVQSAASGVYAHWGGPAGRMEDTEMLTDESRGSVEMDVEMQREEQEAMRRYEEMNRQLGEFAVARRERWGGTWVGDP